MDIDKLIERLYNRASRPRLKMPVDAFTSTGVYTKDTLDKEAADALSTFQVENEKLRAELEQVKRERDAAVSDIETIMAYGGGTCQFCGNGHCYARGGKKPCLPKWRGRKAE